MGHRAARSTDSAERFEARAEDYARYRATYPAPLVDGLAAAQGWREGRTVADIGSGTGIFTTLVLARGPRVFGVEPAAAMRARAEEQLGSKPGFVSIAGLADATGLPDRSVDAIVCAQAFHWFNHEVTRAEWRRILRPGGSAALIWNNLDDADPATRAYLELLYATAPDSREVLASSTGGARHNVLFDARRGAHLDFPHEQWLNLEAFLGRTASLSYAPKPGERAHAALQAGLREIFAAHAREGRLRLAYRSVAVHGPLG